MSVIVRSLAAAALVLTASPALADQVTVFAAASLKTALDRIAAEWQAETGDTVAVSYAGSPQLARQIEQGAPADIFISASAEWMDELQKAGLIDAGSRVDLLGNRLVLIGEGADAARMEIAPGFDLAGRLGAGKLAMALVDSVPAGVYGRQALTRLGVWEAVEPKVAQADNVRAALALVAMGEAPLGIVYATDARAEPKVGVVGIFPEDSHESITYPAALVAGASGKASARAFFDALKGPQARAVFEAEGFAVLP